MILNVFTFSFSLNLYISRFRDVQCLGNDKKYCWKPMTALKRTTPCHLEHTFRYISPSFNHKYEAYGFAPWNRWILAVNLSAQSSQSRSIVGPGTSCPHFQNELTLMHKSCKKTNRMLSVTNAKSFHYKVITCIARNLFNAIKELTTAPPSVHIASKLFYFWCIQ